jgi:protein-S-isoprenylcysteine O-methyltransferase Ste14
VIRLFGLDRTNLNANLWSTALGMGELGMMIAMVIGYALAFIGIGLFIEGWRELYRAHQENRLATDGLYPLVRHPQYSGLFIGLFGEGEVHWPTIFSVTLFPAIVIAYTLLAHREERQMLARFGDQYRAYQRRVPMFFPAWGSWRQFVEHSRIQS